MKYYYWKPKNYIKREYSSKQQNNNKELDNNNNNNNNNTNDKRNNKKNELNEKLKDRFLVKQTNPNPFFIDSNYLDDLDIQNKFLR